MAQLEIGTEPRALRCVRRRSRYGANSAQIREDTLTGERKDGKGVSLLEKNLTSNEPDGTLHKPSAVEVTGGACA